MLTEGDPYWGWDVARFVVGTGALWLAVLVLRLGWIQHRDPDPARPHPLTYLAFAGALLLIGALRIGHIGEPPTWDLFPALAVVLAGMVGVLRRVRLPRRAPHRR